MQEAMGTMSLSRLSIDTKKSGRAHVARHCRIELINSKLNKGDIRSKLRMSSIDLSQISGESQLSCPSSAMYCELTPLLVCATGCDGSVCTRHWFGSNSALLVERSDRLYRLYDHTHADSIQVLLGRQEVLEQDVETSSRLAKSFG